jgi:hypothetical protein
MEMNAQELIQRYKAGERDFSVTELFGANLQGAELSGAILHGADLREANLSGADLREVNLEWAILERVNESSDNQVSLVNVVDPSIIGGFVLRLGDKEYDSSVAYRLNDLLAQFEDNQYISKL